MPPDLRRAVAGRARVLFRYATGSVVATVLSEATFLLAYGPAGANHTLASLVGWLAGAVPNYVLNRRWAWQHRGRVRLLRELVPYVAIVLLTLVVATWATGLAQDHADQVTTVHWQQTLFVGGVFLATYGVMFVVRFVLFDLLFTALRAPALSEDR